MLSLAGGRVYFTRTSCCLVTPLHSKRCRLAVVQTLQRLVPAAAPGSSAQQSNTQVVKNTVNVMAGNTAALAILSWVVSSLRHPLHSDTHGMCKRCGKIETDREHVDSRTAQLNASV